MNVSTIQRMIRDDPSILSDVAGFLKRMNARNIRQVQTVKTVVSDVVKIVSIAEMNGGPATQRDVDDALAMTAKVPLFEEAEKYHAEIRSKIESGEITEPGEIRPATSTEPMK